jgi:cytochrome c oxidase cbb3-type subunit 3
MKTYNGIYLKRVAAFVGSILLPFLALASENEEVKTTSCFSNPLFNTLLLIIIILAIMVSALSGALKNIIKSDFFIEKIKKEKEQNNSNVTKVLMLLLLFSALSLSTYAQEKIQIKLIPKNDGIGGLDQFTFYAMIIIIIMELIVLGILFTVFKNILSSDKAKVGKATVTKPKTKTILDRLNGTVEIEKEESILLDHDYDGIKELDNNLPPWWKYGFYLTILVAVFYLINYHVTKTAPLQAEEYTNSIKKAEKEIAEHMKTSANNVDENTVEMLAEPADINTGKELFILTCAPCHGKYGEGTVGPNLTDDYWLHGGSVKDIFKTIKYGWTDKGMKSWKEDFSPIQIAQLASYIKSLRGTNPPKPKDKQGELYVDQNSPADSTSLKTDSVKVLTVKALSQKH